ncbi:MAG: BrnT family toxin [Desulfobacterales bacterium]|nr:BrnT family toxin [Desulfobacterales bacterium]
MFEWDKSKAKKNLLKHGINFADTFAVFDDPNAVT